MLNILGMDKIDGGRRGLRGARITFFASHRAREASPELYRTPQADLNRKLEETRRAVQSIVGLISAAEFSHGLHDIWNKRKRLKNCRF